MSFTQILKTLSWGWVSGHNQNAQGLHGTKNIYHQGQRILAAAKSLQLCPTLCDPIDGSPPGSPVPGILQARRWSGLPFPPPMHESEKWKEIRSVVSDLWRPHGLQPTRLLRPWDFPGKSTGVGCHCLLREDAEKRENSYTVGGNAN